MYKPVFYKVFEVESDLGILFGIEDSAGGVLYVDNFDNRDEAEKFADAHNKGAESYEEAFAMIYGPESDPSTYPYK